MDFLLKYNLRSKSSPLTSSGAETNNWAIFGMIERADRPITLGSTGTSRQPSMAIPLSLDLFSNSARTTAFRWSSLGKKHIATAYRPSFGNLMPSCVEIFRIKASGIWIVIPAPSPVIGSAPEAPRCPRFTNTSSAWSMIERERVPLMSATIPTPHASCSNSGTYSPRSAMSVKSGKTDSDLEFQVF